MEQVISKATRRNWNRLETDTQNRLAKRANKKMSVRKIVPVEYFFNKNNLFAVADILSIMDRKNISLMDILCSVAENLLAGRGILDKSNVQQVLSEYSYNRIESVINYPLPEDEKDLLGIIYQAAMFEGVKNQKGSYYTPHNIISDMVSSLTFESGQTFLDPCCGSGAFLCALPCNDPELLYGTDNDPLAVMIAKINLLLRYPDKDFIPNIICCDFLTDEPFAKQTFDYAITNPPWGASIGDAGSSEIVSREIFSLFFVKSYQLLKKNGIIRFLLPESVLNVKIHRDIRNFILEKCSLESLTVYDGCFAGVFTNFVNVECRKKSKTEIVRINHNGQSYNMDISVFAENKNKVFNFLTSTDIEIIERCRSCGKYTLQDSLWALGIVTGDNKRKLLTHCEQGSEAIYTGKDIVPFGLRTPCNYILYDRKTLQQTAPDEYYRASEKLVYKFISDKLIFAYDERQRLFLNSANILIPRIPGMSIKTVMAFLNSELYSYLYKKMFGELKILKGNLLQLPFPDISDEQNLRIKTLTESIMSGRAADVETLQMEIYSLFNLTEKQIKYIKDFICVSV